MRTRRLLTVLLLSGASAGVAAGCGDDDGPTGPVPGTVQVSLVTPNVDDGAVLFSVTGGEIGEPTSANAAHVFFFRRQASSSVTVAIVGDLTDGPLLEFDVPDVGDIGLYTATLLEVSDRTNRLRATLTDYDLPLDEVPSP